MKKWEGQNEYFVNKWKKHKRVEKEQKPGRNVNDWEKQTKNFVTYWKESLIISWANKEETKILRNEKIRKTNRKFYKYTEEERKLDHEGGNNKEKYIF